MIAPSLALLLLLAGMMVDTGNTDTCSGMADVDPAELVEELLQHSEIFERRIIHVTENIHVAIGYTIANSIMIEAPEGLIIVDASENVETGLEILADFRQLSAQPIKAIIYTHQHADHTWGTQAFVEDPSNPPEVWAYQSTAEAMTLFLTTGSAARLSRSYRMLGRGLVDTTYAPISLGIGPSIVLDISDEYTIGPIYPTRVLADETETTQIAGLNVTLFHIPGETDDQIGVWIPRDQAFLCGDDVYQAFPNIYTIRGAPARDAVHWFTSIDLMIDLEPEHLVPSHTLPICGNQNIQDVLIPYRDGIQYVHDQTVRWMNKGMTPDDIANTVCLPDSLAQHPYLREYYGTTFWSVKGIFDKYLGWFSGDPVDLFPLHSDDKAQRMLELAGGLPELILASQTALADERFQWALELSTHALKVDSTNEEARDVKVEALTSLAARQLSTNARNYYNTLALEEITGTSVEIDIVSPEIMEFLAIEDLVTVLRMRYMPEMCGGRDTVAVFEFPDDGKVISIKLRNSVAVVKHELLPVYDIKVTTTVAIFKQVMIENSVIFEKLTDGSFVLEGVLFNFLWFMACFQG